MQGEVWDAAVVGAGPAGAAAAYDLAAAGARVLLLDRAEFPRPKACAGGLTHKAVRALRYSIDPVVRRWERSLLLEEASGRAVRVARRAPVCAMTMREELDSFCLRTTVERGAVFQRIGPISAIEQQQDRVVLRFGRENHPEESMEARYLLGADGVHSRVRALTVGEAPWFRRGFAVEANVPYGPGEQLPSTVFDFAPVARGYGWLFPRDTHVNVGLYVEEGAAGAVNREVLEQYIAARCGPGRKHARPVGQFLGLGAAGYRPQEGTRVLLAGDAAGFVDPLTGEGIYGAIRSGQVAAEAIAAALGLNPSPSGRRRLFSAQGKKQMSLAAAFLAAARGLQGDLQVAEHGARRFYSNPAQGFRLMRMPLLPRLALEVYSEGLPLGALLAAARLAARFAGS